MIGINKNITIPNDFRTNKVLLNKSVYNVLDKSKDEDIVLKLPNIKTIPYWHIVDKDIIDINQLNIEFIFEFYEKYRPEIVYLYLDFFEELKDILYNNVDYKFNINSSNGKDESIEEITISTYHINYDSVADIDFKYYSGYSPTPMFDKKIYLTIKPKLIEIYESKRNY